MEGRDEGEVGVRRGMREGEDCTRSTPFSRAWGGPAPKKAKRTAKIRECFTRFSPVFHPFFARFSPVFRLSLFCLFFAFFRPFFAFFRPFFTFHPFSPIFAFSHLSPFFAFFHFFEKR